MNTKHDTLITIHTRIQTESKYYSIGLNKPHYGGHANVN